MTPLHRVAGDLELTRALLEHGAKVNAMDDTGSTPLHSLTLSCRRESDGDFAECAKLLIEYGADVNAKTFPEDKLPSFGPKFPPVSPMYWIENNDDPVSLKVKKILVDAGAKQ